MKFSSIALVASLSAMASAAPDYTVPYTYTGAVTCTDQTTTMTVTETQTVTVTGGNQMATTPPPTPAPSVYTNGGTVTSIDYGTSGQSTVYVYPTGAGKQDIIKVTYQEEIVTEIVVINIDIIIVNGVTSTVTTTLTAPPNTTPPPPPPPPASSTTTVSAAPAQTHMVQVGVDGLLAYGPNQLNAAVGDTIRFEFLKQNHTVTQSSLAEPCTKLDGGFDSGFNFFNPNNVTDSATFTTDFVVNTDKPLWFYCRQTVPKSHCHAGMVLGVNPGDKFDQFLANAEAQGQPASKRDHVRRGEPVPVRWRA